MTGKSMTLITLAVCVICALNSSVRAQWNENSKYTSVNQDEYINASWRFKQLLMDNEAYIGAINATGTDTVWMFKVNANNEIVAGTKFCLPDGSSDNPSIVLASDDDTGFYKAWGGAWYFSINGDAHWLISGDCLGHYNGKSGAIYDVYASATSPTLLPFWNDINTGIGGVEDDTLSLIAGGVEGIRVAEGSGANSIIVSVNGDFTISSNGALIGNSNIRGSDSFDGTAVADTILNDTFNSTDYFFVQLTGAVGDSIKTLFITAKEDTLIVNREADGDANQTYNWFKIE